MLFSTKAKNPRTAFRGFFYSVLLWRLNPQAGHRLFITIQPFDDVTAGSILLPSFTTPVSALRATNHLPAPDSTFSYMIQMTRNMRISTPALLETVYGCRIIYRTSDENMARLPGGDPF